MDPFNVKQIENALKKVERRLDDIKKETTDLLKQRNALKIVLNPKLGADIDLREIEQTLKGKSPTVAIRKRTRRGIHTEILKVMEDRQLSVREICEHLQTSGAVEFKTNRPDASVSAALVRHPELFSFEDGRWQLKGREESIEDYLK